MMPRYPHHHIGSRTNNVDSSMRRLAGSTLVAEAHAELPLTYMIVEIVYGKTVPVGSQGNKETSQSPPAPAHAREQALT